MIKKEFILEEEFALINKTGIGQYTLLLERILKNTNNKVSLFSKDVLNRIKNKHIRFIAYILWLNTIFIFKLFLKSIKSEVTLIGTNFYLPSIKLPNVKYVVVIHDIRMFLFPDTLSKLGSFIFKKTIMNSIYKADKIITVSKSVKDELVENFQIPPERINIVYNSINENFTSIESSDNSILEKLDLISKKYIISVATLQEHKNIKSLIQAFESLSNDSDDFKLVLVGKLGNDKSALLNKKSNIIFTDYISDKDLIKLYKNALIYVFPSIYEGFGIPLIEAQKSKIPVACSDIPVFREVAQDSAEFFQPKPKNIKEKIEFLINNPKRQEEMVIEGEKNLKRFSFEEVKTQLKEALNIES